MDPPQEFPSESFPTPVFECPELATDSAELWVKNDGLTHPIYGGNKVRKLIPLIARARASGCSRVLTFGAAGSHHVLTTAIFARAARLSAAAVLLPQHRTEHVELTLRAALAQGLEALAVPRPRSLPEAIRHAWKRGTYLIPPGGSNVIGTLAYASAVAELSAQVRSGTLPAPDVIVVPMGSGGTCAGLLAGVIAQRLEARVSGVLVAKNPAARSLALGLAAAALKRLRVQRGDLAHRLEITRRYIGEGYGIATEAGRRATRIAAAFGLTLDETYTAKAFACALELLSMPRAFTANRRLRILYWHTLSAVPLTPLLSVEARARVLPSNLSALLR